MQLLAEYASGRSETAFATLVSRHINLVYSAAFRSVNNSSQAEEITQAVFITLARKAALLGRGTVLSGWLYQTARLTARNFVRTENRRQQREHEAFTQSTMNEPDPKTWTSVGPLLDEAMAQLNEKDRNAIVLRFFEGKPLREVGDAIGASEDAAKMRVNRALDKLREFLRKRGITVSAAALASAISENSIQAAPAGLAAAVAAAAASAGHGAAATASALTLAKGVVHMITSTKIGLAVGACAAAAVIGMQYHQLSAQKETVKALQAQVVQAQRLEQKARATQDLEAKVQQLEKQNTDYAQSIESMKREMLKSRAHAAAALDAKSAAVAAAAKAGQGGSFSAMFKDPEVMKVLKEQQAGYLRLQYAPFVKQMNFTPEQAAQFYQILTDQATKGMDALQSGKLPDWANHGNSSNADLKSLLGDDGMVKFNDFSQTIAAQAVLTQYKTSFQDNPLTDAQEQQLLQTIKSATSNANASPPNAGQTDPGNFQAILSQQADRLDQINQNVLQQAAAFLSPDQLQSLGAAQSNLLAMQKFGLTMAQKMFTNSPGSH